MFRKAVMFFLLTLTTRLYATPIDFWHSMAGDKGKLVESLVADFNSKQKNQIHIKTQYVGSYVEGINKLRASLMAGRSPHIVQIYEIGTQVMIDSRAVVPLTDFIKQDEEFPEDQLLPQIARYYEVDGKLYSLPFATSNPILYYNRDLFQNAGLSRAPRTFEELSKYSAKLTDKKSKRSGVTWPLHSWFFEQFMARQGADLVDNDNGRAARAKRALYARPEGVRFVTLWQKMVAQGSFANVGRGWDPAEQNFLAGRSAMFITSTSDVFEVANKAKFRVGTAPLPLPSGKTSPGGTIIGGNSLWILKDKPKHERTAAFEFIKYMASFEVQRKWHTGTGYFPIRNDVIEKLEKEGFYKKHPAARTAIDQLLASVPVSATRGALMGVFPEARDHIESAIEQVLAGKVGVKAALQKAAERTEKAMRRYNRMYALK